ncbi:hypothetical protein C0Q64_14450 [Streptomyces albidoflavus]|nr:hypothetical protein C0Q64_14450 [Streptomyces albidoflavus]RZE01818.1 hypothetical protein C0Q65_14760 [Streptomyces albidoflavus]
MAAWREVCAPAVPPPARPRVRPVAAAPAACHPPAAPGAPPGLRPGEAPPSAPVRLLRTETVRPRHPIRPEATLTGGTVPWSGGPAW